MNNTTTGISERVLYGLLSALALQGVGYGWWTADMAAYIAGGGVMLIGGAWAWWRNRPGNLMDRAAAQMPPNTTLFITTDPQATRQERDAAHDLARSSGPNVKAKVTV